MEQKNLFGNDVNINDINRKKKKLSVQQLFRKNFGNDIYHRCQDCKFIETFIKNKRNYYRCRKMGSRKDKEFIINKEEYACRLYSKRRSD